jgi:hypothetical protein
MGLNLFMVSDNCALSGNAWHAQEAVRGEFGRGKLVVGSMSLARLRNQGAPYGPSPCLSIWCSFLDDLALDASRFLSFHRWKQAKIITSKHSGMWAGFINRG